MKNLTVNRLRKYDNNTDIFVNRFGFSFRVYKIWELLEHDSFNNDTERNEWLRAEGFTI